MQNNKKLKKIARKLGTPIYLYDGEIIKRACKELKKCFEKVDLYYACKANTSPEIIKMIFRQGFGIETVSPGEIAIARNVGIPVSRITFTCGNIDDRELISVAKQGVRIHLDSLHQVETFGKNFPGKEISVRLNLGVGAGHHAHVVTGGKNSKFGIDISQIEKLKNLTHKYNLQITSLHQHIGSNILDIPILLEAIQTLLNTALSFPHLKHLEMGGGFGIPYRPNDKKLNLEMLSRKLKTLILNFNKKYGRKIAISFEPGRYVVAKAGNLLVEVNDIKQNPSQTFVGVNSGMNHFVRPTMYGSYHEIVNISNSKDKKEKVTVAGNICESGDIFAKDRLIAKSRIGDILAIKNVGAYGYEMSSEYNSRPRPRKFLLLGNKLKRLK